MVACGRTCKFPFPFTRQPLMLTTIFSRQTLETEGLPSDKRLPGIAERSIKMDGRRRQSVVPWV